MTDAGSYINLKINEIAEKLFSGNNTKFAEAVGTSETNIRNYRKGRDPKAAFFKSLHDKLEISYEWLFNDTGEMQSKTPSSLSDEGEKSVEIDKNPIVNLRSIEQAILLMSERQNGSERYLQTLSQAVENIQRILTLQGKDIRFLVDEAQQQRRGKPVPSK